MATAFRSGKMSGTEVKLSSMVMLFAAAFLISASNCEVTNVATDWTQLLSEAICTKDIPFVEGASQLAQLHTIQWQSLVALFANGKKAVASQQVVVAFASHYVYITHYPSEFVAADQLLKAQLKAEQADVYERNQARQFAHSVAAHVLKERVHDGWDYSLGNLQIPTSSQAIKGEFAFDNPPQDFYYPIPSTLFSQTMMAKTYILPDVELFRLAKLSTLKPPQLSSTLFINSAKEVKSLGSDNSTTRTSTQTKIARFWLSSGPDKGAICSVSNFYVTAAMNALPKSTTLYGTVTTLAKVSVAGFDATVLALHMQYSFRGLRPAAAIRAGYGVTADPTWTAVLPTPNHPEWPSVTATEAAAGAAVLAAILGDKTSFSVAGGMNLDQSGANVGPRSYTSFSASAAEASDSRVYAGAHFRHSVDAARIVGRAVARYVLENWGKRTPSGVLPQMQHLYWYSGRISKVGVPQAVQIVLPKSGAAFYDPLPTA